MNVDTRVLFRLDRIPTAILQAIIDLIQLCDVKHLSSVSKRLREACLSNLFCHVGFEFSQAGIEELHGLSKSYVLSYVVSFTYNIPALLKKGEYHQQEAEFTLMLVKSSRSTTL